MIAALDSRAPRSFQKIVALFSAFEFGLNSLALYQHTPDFEAIKLAVESSSQSQFTLDHLQQILWLLPNAYIVQWKRPSKAQTARGSSSELDNNSIASDTQPVLLVRRQRVKSNEINGEEDSLANRINSFIERVNAFLREKINSLPENLLEKDITAALELIEIERAPLPENPASCVSKKKQRLDKIEESLDEESSCKENEQLEQALAAPVAKELEGLPMWLIERVRRKEHKHKRVEQKTATAQKERLYSTLPRLCDQLQSYSLVKRRYVFPIQELIRDLAPRSTMRDHVATQLSLLEDLIPFWVTILITEGHEYVKLDRHCKYNVVKSSLRKAISTIL